ncbi:hypothetical protein D9757_013453 [Collybiopsis confluens]|uniref:cutinase n=1 Tax=Collybiopsis confluens TaxID=2823264 RepID=A0A8H5GAA3_9AGAR|nr:hypothetical protein D9757_013453 [Collybiopsis confluens]
MVGLKTTLVALALSLHALAAPVLDTRQACADVIVIYARGTTETAPIGDSTSVGADLEADLVSALGGKSLSFQGVDYPASILGFLEGGDPQGSTNMATMLTSAATSCPNVSSSQETLYRLDASSDLFPQCEQAAIVSSGYSQGGQLVHNSAKQLSAAVSARINAVVIFGDPDDGQAVAGIAASKVDVICHTGDNICQGGIEVLPPHLDYQMDTPSAAAFIAARV